MGGGRAGRKGWKGEGGSEGWGSGVGLIALEFDRSNSGLRITFTINWSSLSFFFLTSTLPSHAFNLQKFMLESDGLPVDLENTM